MKRVEFILFRRGQGGGGYENSCELHHPNKNAIKKKIRGGFGLPLDRSCSFHCPSSPSWRRMLLAGFKARPKGDFFFWCFLWFFFLLGQRLFVPATICGSSGLGAKKKIYSGDYQRTRFLLRLQKNAGHSRWMDKGYWGNCGEMLTCPD